MLIFAKPNQPPLVISTRLMRWRVHATTLVSSLAQATAPIATPALHSARTLLLFRAARLLFPRMPWAAVQCDKSCGSHLPAQQPPLPPLYAARGAHASTVNAPPSSTERLSPELAPIQRDRLFFSSILKSLLTLRCVALDGTSSQVLLPL